MLLVMKSAAAKDRWKLLAQALKKAKKDNFDSSVRNFCGYDLFLIEKTKLNLKETENWYSYNLKSTENSSSILVRHLNNNFSAEELCGFNNTGNVCIWPSEEILAYYCDKLKGLFKNKRIIELGCGMSALAGLQIATTMETRKVCLSDGNVKGIENLNFMLKANKEKFLSPCVESLSLKWNENIETDHQMQHLAKSFDVIISADCLFFVNFQKALVNTVKFLLAPGGIGIFFAPKRSGTFVKFVELAREVFDVTVNENYDEIIWQKYQEYSQSLEHFNADLHYPVLVELREKGFVS